jgi:ribose-phosphate pyrophosphokinase
MKILPGTSSIELGKKIAERLKIPLLELKVKYFNDGESYLKIIGSVKNQEIILIQNTSPPQEKNLMELLFIASTLKDLGALKVHCIIPYLCYARADRRRLDGEVTSHQITLDLIQKSGVDTLATLRVHNQKIFLETNRKLKKYNIDFTALLIPELQKAENKDWYIIGPDKGSHDDIEKIAQRMSKPFATFEKYRDPHTHEVSLKDTGFDCHGKDAILIDDAITSGGTAFDAINLIKQKKPSSLTYFCVHALAKKETFIKMKQIGVTEIISLNTIPKDDIEQIDITSHVSKFIEENLL